ncbi:MAG TPA: TIGR02594 family protein [Pseudolabrys sp.]|jgi:uncharacterized protein (TIGR02594 family)
MIMISPHLLGVYAPAFDGETIDCGGIALITRGLHKMRLIQKRATLLLCSVAIAAFATSAIARPVHKSAHRHHAARVVAQSQSAEVNRDDRYPQPTAQASAQGAAAVEPETGRHRGRHAAHTGDAFGGMTSDALVSEARKYLGTNPTGRGSQWCGAFMDMVLKRTGHAGGGNLARAYAGYGTRVSGPQVGAIAVMNHHVGVVSGIDANGNPIIVSGNHNRTVAESVYPRARIAAYVLPGG